MLAELTACFVVDRYRPFRDERVVGKAALLDEAVYRLGQLLLVVFEGILHIAIGGILIFFYLSFESDLVDDPNFPLSCQPIVI